ncbi:MFS transporter [Desmospora profundinema]|uniref:PPP family 3-phenylpropionic acid transporter n=1 Tax=Desmospora profundinema TaxID=1571184 RepID=A0ABU1IJM4_9BACL|nr:MFS transporter [Desmospora profundinema]MDR6224971.1 PPP family 3-phenylpropionic acid transporter [Desmospora profundinema]
MHRNTKQHWIFSTFFFLIFFGFGGFFPLLSVYFREEVGLTGTQIGTILSVGPIVMVFAQPVWGIICDYTQRSNQVLILTVAVTGLLGLGYLVLEEYVWLLVLAATLAAFQASVIPISDNIAINFVHRTGGDYGNLRLWGALGFAVAAFIMGELSDRFGLIVIFFGFAASLWLSAWVGLALPKERIAFDIDLRAGLRQLMKLPPFGLFLLATFLVFGPIHANNVYFGLLVQDLGGTLAGVGLGFLLAAGSEVPFMKFAGRWIRQRGLLTVTIFAAGVSGLRWLLYAWEPSLLLVYLSTIAQGMSVGLFIPAALEYVRTISPKEVQATAISLYAAMGVGLGNWFFSLVGGIILDRFDIFVTYLLFGVMTLVGVCILLGLRRMEKRLI